ncbi:MAG TPA: sulfatase-like hydrolase/transferase [Armatimonadota bacterium]|nr:sulfatase-like hydrolase/transferase [Armatimonadota bacterium]
MNRREFLKQAGVGAATLALPWALPGFLQAAEDKGTKPNIIFILSDDVGLGDIGCYGSDRYKTPRIDELAKGGIRYDRCFAEPLCGPSRCESLTGRYPFRTGMISNQSGAVPRPENEIMIPKVLKPAGYVTAAVGKWSQLQLEPSDWGFDEYLRFNGSGKYWAEQDPTYTLNGKKVDLPKDKYLPDVMHEFLADFITRHKDQPFYVHYAMSHVHGPILRTPDSTATSDHYADNLSYMDKLVGRLMDELDKQKLRDKTLIVFVGDNGTAPGHADNSTVNGKRLSGQKGTMQEGGSLVPMIVNWPGTTPAGKASNDLIDFSDYMPTFTALAGAKLPDDRPIDGHDFSPQIKGKKGNPREWVYVELTGRWYVRSQDWKLTRSGELFDMSEAPFVEKPVPADTTDPKAIEARKQLQAVLDKLNPAAGKQAVITPKQKKKKKKPKAVIQ